MDGKDGYSWAVKCIWRSISGTILERASDLISNSEHASQAKVNAPASGAFPDEHQAAFHLNPRFHFIDLSPLLVRTIK